MPALQCTTSGGSDLTPLEAGDAVDEEVGKEAEDEEGVASSPADNSS